MPLHDFRSVFLPYCLERNKDGDYTVLNREYKPIGFGDRAKWEKYSDYPITYKFKGLTAARLAKVTVSPAQLPGRIFLYDDSCVPTTNAANMRSYLDRLKILIPLRVELQPPK